MEESCVQANMRPFPNVVFDVGPTSKQHWGNAPCFLGCPCDTVCAGQLVDNMCILNTLNSYLIGFIIEVLTR